MASTDSIKTRALPRFPPELWLKIFGLATSVPGLMNCNDVSQSDLPHTILKKKEQDLLKKSLVTKRNLVQVCRTWHDMAVEFLYQSIIISRVNALSSLHNALQRSSESSPHRVSLSTSSFGWWTKRLDVIIQDDRCEGSDYTLLAEIIRHFSNLTIVTLSMPMLPYRDCWLRQLPTSLLTALAETCGSSLRVFDCSESILRPCREDLMMLLGAAANLQILRCPICSPSPGGKPSLARVDMPVMPKLQSVMLMSVFLRDYLPKDKDANRFPALRELTYDCIPPPFYDHAWKNFVKISCASVTTVYLDYCLFGESLQKELDLLAECCPALDKLVIFLRSWTELKHHLVLPPVSYLGLHSKLLDAPPVHYLDLFTSLNTIVGSKLKVVRLIHEAAVRNLRNSASAQVKEEIANLTSGTFRVEDHEGRLLTV
ncbi:hypothetical protein BJ138DRAFT_1134967 [Hygrophoropsis aurantiaca]|uniref:Uncharacterized protein n=1 Tax=Hygrophoropsis aurantiaca TaxID=72124 RepID=A0ACB8AFG1_9AGAM|nr:hypothetical protein BJ138DRAFT_1134967 [Hygrophoropsis aurantiaca]